MSLKSDLQNCGEKSVDELEVIYSNYNQQHNFVSELIKMIEIERLQTKATWLVKKNLEKGYKINDPETSKIWHILPKLNSWEAKLHILQSFPMIPMTVNDLDLIETFLRECLASKNKFVRAWAYGGFYLMADQFSEYRQEAVQLLENANLTESASVKARLRKVTKTGFLSHQDFSFRADHT